MAKYNKFIPSKKEEEYIYPSRFGSHSSMVDDEKTISLRDLSEIKEDEVALEDENGLYISKLKRVDSGLADPNRYANVRKI